MKNRILNFILLILPIATVFAQVPPPPDYGEDASGGPGAPGAPSKTPIDQIEFLMLLAGVALILGIYYYMKSNKVSEA